MQKTLGALQMINKKHNGSIKNNYSMIILKSFVSYMVLRALFKYK